MQTKNLFITDANGKRHLVRMQKDECGYGGIAFAKSGGMMSVSLPGTTGYEHAGYLYQRAVKAWIKNFGEQSTVTYWRQR